MESDQIHFFTALSFSGKWEEPESLVLGLTNDFMQPSFLADEQSRKFWFSVLSTISCSHSLWRMSRAGNFGSRFYQRFPETILFWRMSGAGKLLDQCRVRVLFHF